MARSVQSPGPDQALGRVGAELVGADGVEPEGSRQAMKSTGLAAGCSHKRFPTSVILLQVHAGIELPPPGPRSR